MLRKVTAIKRVVYGSFVLIGAAVSACGSAARPGSSEAGAAQNFAAQATTQVCNSLGACCGASSFPFDATECKTAIGPAIAQQFEAEAVPWNGQPHSVVISLPPLAGVILAPG